MRYSVGKRNGDQSRWSNPQRKRRIEAESPKSPATVSSPRRSTQPFRRQGALKRTPITPRQSNEHSLARPRTRTRLSPHSLREKSAHGLCTSRSPSLRPPDELSDGRSATLSAEPPPVEPSRPAASEQAPPLDEYLELERVARHKFLHDGDVSGLNTLLDPFRKGDQQKEFSNWIYDTAKQRWWRKDMSTGMIIWAPTADSLL